MRFLVITLLLVVVFLGGTLFGINQQEVSVVEKPESESSLSETADENVSEVDTNSNLDVDYEVEPETQVQPMEVEGPLNMTQKMASFLEAGVVGFYDLVVGFLYQISQMFF